MNTIYFTRTTLKALKNAYHNALIQGKEEFQFEGHTLLVSYAKYLIEYLDSEFSRK